MSWEDFIIPAIVIALAVLISVGIIAGGNQLEKASCGQQAEAMQVVWDYGLLKGCLIMTKGGWLPLDNYRYFGD